MSPWEANEVFHRKGGNVRMLVWRGVMGGRIWRVPMERTPREPVHR